jgi:asparagine synthase (glutamine-hydrolysing)
VNVLGRSAARRQVVAAVNQYAPQAEADERTWARAACGHAGLPLLEVEKPEARIAVEDFTGLATGVRPAVAGLDVVRDRMLVATAGELGVDAIMTGQGGDGVLFQMPSALVAADLLAEEGLKAFADPRVAELCRWLRRSAWSVWREALRPSRGPASDATHLWGPRARVAAAGPAHPWLDGIADLPPGKQVQLEYLTFCQAKYGRSLRSRALTLLHPLLSQPVMELCLSIPSWELVRGGRDRGLARDAFASLIPAVVAERRSKGELSTLYTRRVAASLDVLRPLLLDGVLAEAEILDRAAVDAALTPEGLIWRGDGLRLLHAAAVEAWVRHWQGRVPDLASAPRDRAA